eukprot:TRINITY_DN13918_c0_g1_i3.p1 TRINITY_DN13918_c0_g1~~TRINITY_DN13918_c0_g1_i3.p1  ORF type:complete len:432 (+),score=121.71 TRINITY_DN13918_c0_g1_i3:46-1341(+)
MVGGAASAAKSRREEPGHAPRGGRGAGPSAATLAAIFLMYAVQGVPFGFVDNFLPLRMYGDGASLQEVGLMSMAGLPWLLKWLWAPLVDSTPPDCRYGQYRSWILPSHVVMMLACGVCALLRQGSPGLGAPFAAAVLLWTTATAVEDCAVDGFAMAVMAQARRQGGSSMLSLTNFAQVVGFKLGHLYAGAPLWWVFAAYGWAPQLWLFLAAPVALVFVVVLVAEEPEPPPPPTTPPPSGSSASGHLLETLRNAKMRRLMLLAGSYKVGEKVLLSMFKPALVDAGYAPSEVGSWVGWHGTMSSTLGSALAAWGLRTVEARTALQLALAVRVALFALSLGPVPPQLALAAQGFGAGAVTPAMFAYLMDAVADCTSPVTSYTVLQCCDDLSRFGGYTVAGSIAAAAGYRTTFGAAVVLSAVPMALLPLREEKRA